MHFIELEVRKIYECVPTYHGMQRKEMIYRETRKLLVYAVAIKSTYHFSVSKKIK